MEGPEVDLDETPDGEDETRLLSVVAALLVTWLFPGTDLRATLFPVPVD